MTRRLMVLLTAGAVLVVAAACWRGAPIAGPPGPAAGVAWSPEDENLAATWSAEEPPTAVEAGEAAVAGWDFAALPHPSVQELQEGAAPARPHAPPQRQRPAVPKVVPPTAVSTSETPLEIATSPSPQSLPAPTATPLRTSILGSLLRPGDGGRIVPAAHAEIHLVDLATLEIRDGTTDVQGAFRFDGAEPSRAYYVVAAVTARVSDGSVAWDYRYGWDAARGVWGWRMEPVAGRPEARLSWHVAVSPPAVGAWRVDLAPSNADEQFNADVRPVNDPISRTPYRSWHRAELQRVEDQGGLIRAAPSRHSPERML